MTSIKPISLPQGVNANSKEGKQVIRGAVLNAVRTECLDDKGNVNDEKLQELRNLVDDDPKLSKENSQMVKDSLDILSAYGQSHVLNSNKLSTMWNKVQDNKDIDFRTLTTKDGVLANKNQSFISGQTPEQTAQKLAELSSNPKTRGINLMDKDNRSLGTAMTPIGDEAKVKDAAVTLRTDKIYFFDKNGKCLGTKGFGNQDTFKPADAKTQQKANELLTTISNGFWQNSN